MKYKFNIKFTNKALNFINVARILLSKEIIDSCRDFVEQDDIHKVIYTLTQCTMSKISFQRSEYYIFCGKA